MRQPTPVYFAEMYSSERFLARISKFRKTNRSEPVEKQMEMIRLSFTDMNRHLPTGLVEELLDRFTLNLTEGPEDSAFDRCEKLADVVDVLHEEYDSESDPLNAQDWTAIGDTISEYARNVDMGFLTYIMKLAVDHHAV
ncbi:MAG: hypothetical protein V3S41_00475 [Spirochaetia bacterium]